MCLSALPMLAPSASAAGAHIVDTPPIERRPIITISADDGHASVYNYAYPILSQYDIVQTFFVPSDYVGKENYVSLEQLLELQAAGWEIGSHGVNHTSLTTLTFSDAMDQLSRSKTMLTDMGLNVETFAYPFGTSNQAIANFAKEHYLAARSVSSVYERYSIAPELVSLSGDDLAGTEIKPTMTLTDVKALIDQAISEGKWLNLYYHTATADGKIGEGSITIDDLAEYVASKRDAGLCDVLTFRDGYYRCRAMTERLTPSIVAGSQSDEVFSLKRNVIEDTVVVVEGVTYSNVLANPSFEIGGAYTATGYSKFAGITAWTSSPDAMVGDYSVLGTADPGAAASTRVISTSVILADIGISPGDHVFYGMNFKNIENVTMIAAQLQFIGESGLISSLSASENVTGDYARYPTDAASESKGRVVPEGTTKITVTLRISTISEGATEATFLTDGWFLAKVPYNVQDRAYIGLRPAFDYIGPSTNSTAITMMINGQTYSIADELGSGQTVEVSVPYQSIIRVEDIVVGGCGVVMLSVTGERILDSIGPEIISVNGTAPDITVTTAPYVGDGKAICYWGDRITMVSESSVKHYTGSGGMCVVDLAGGMEQRIVSTTTYQIDNAMSPLYAVIPVVFVLAVIGGLITMIGRVRY